MTSNKFLEAAEKWKNDEISPKQETLEEVTSSQTVGNENILLFSSGNGIFILDTDNSVKKIAERAKRTFSICFHNGELYDSGEEGIFETCSNKEMKKYFHSTAKMCSHNRDIYFESSSEIYSLFGHKTIAYRSRAVKNLTYNNTHPIAFCSYEGKLYDGGSYERIFETFKNIMVAKRDSPVRALCVHNGVLYDASGNNICKTFSRKMVAHRSTFVHDLCSHNNELYDCFRNKIAKTLENKIVYESEQDIWAIFSHPRNYFVEKRILT